MTSSAPGARVRLSPGPLTTVLEALAARFPHIPLAEWRRRMAEGLVCDAEHRPLPPETPLRTEMLVRYARFVATETPIPFEAQVLYADAHLVVADKPHFLPVTPAGEYVQQTLLARLTKQLDNPALVPLHRIDRDTAGLVLFSAQAESRGRYQALFRERRIEKRYEAWAPALPALQFPLVYRSRLVPGEPFFRMQEAPGEANSETGIAVLDRDGPDWRYALTPVTGRKHQLRVHLAALGAPIRHDPLYPVCRPNASDDFTRPLQLLARSLRFTDPLTGEVRHFQSARELART